jgi:hypothetical protein
MVANSNIRPRTQEQLHCRKIPHFCRIKQRSVPHLISHVRKKGKNNQGKNLSQYIKAVQKEVTTTFEQTTADNIRQNQTK